MLKPIRKDGHFLFLIVLFKKKKERTQKHTDRIRLVEERFAMQKTLTALGWAADMVLMCQI